MPPGPPKLPADVAASRRAEPPPSPVKREPESPSQLGEIVHITQRLEQSVQSNAAGLRELLAEIHALSNQVKTQPVPVKELAVPPPLITPPPPRSPGVLAPVAAMIAAIAALGALAGAALLIREQKHLLVGQTASAAEIQSLRQSVIQLTETVASQQTAAVHPAPGGKSAPSGEGPAKPADPANPDSPAGACPAAADGASKTRVLLPNLVGLRLAEARTAVAPLQLQLLPTDKKLKEISKIGWQLPNPGAELEPDEAVTVSLKPPPPKKKKK